MKSKGLRPWICKLAGVNVRNPKKTFIGEDVVLDSNHPEDITIEEGVRLATGVHIVTHFLNSDNSYSRGKVIIKQGANIGMCALIVKPVTIGKRSIVGAGSVVTKDIPDGEVWVGNPARFIKKSIF